LKRKLRRCKSGGREQSEDERLLDTLKKLGLADKDIRTSNYSVYTERVSPPAPGAEANANQMITMSRIRST